MKFDEFVNLVLNKIKDAEARKNYSEVVRLLIGLNGEINHQISEYSKLEDGK